MEKNVLSKLQFLPPPAPVRALFVQATGQEKFPAFAESEAKFFLKVVDAQISFVEDDSGAIVSLILHQNGANQPARKVK